MDNTEHYMRFGSFGSPGNFVDNDNRRPLHPARTDAHLRYQLYLAFLLIYDMKPNLLTELGWLGL